MVPVAGLTRPKRPSPGFLSWGARPVFEASWMILMGAQAHNHCSRVRKASTWSQATARTVWVQEAKGTA